MKHACVTDIFEKYSIIASEITSNTFFRDMNNYNQLDILEYNMILFYFRKSLLRCLTFDLPLYKVKEQTAIASYQNSLHKKECNE